jgi:hypothetical protein
MYAFGRALLPFATPRSAAAWQAAFQRQPQPSGLTSVSVAIDQQPPSTRVRTMRQGSRPLPPRSRASEPAPEPAAPAPLYAKTMALPQAAAQVPVKTTLGQSAAEMLPAVRPRKRPVALVAAGGGLLVAGVVALALRGSPPAPAPAVAPPPSAPVAPATPPAPRTFRVIMAITPAEAQLELDGLPAGQGTLDRELTADGREHTLKVTAAGFEPRTITFLNTPPARTLELTRVAAPPEPARHKPGSARPRAAKPAQQAPNVGANQAPILKE